MVARDILKRVGGDDEAAIMVTHVTMTEKDPIWCWGRSVLQKKTDDDGSSGGLTQPILLSNQTHTKHVKNINDELVQDLTHLRKAILLSN